MYNFIEEQFEQFHNDERILVVTHNGIMRAVKRIFMNRTNDIMSKNLGTIVLSEEDYRKYKDRDNYER